MSYEKGHTEKRPRIRVYHVYPFRASLLLFHCSLYLVTWVTIADYTGSGPSSIPISFFWYGWTADKAIHWIVPIIALFPFGFGFIGIFSPIQAYLIDSFPMYAASAVAALMVSRSLLGALLPLAGPTLYQTLGLGWGNSLLGFVALAMVPAPYYLWKFGGSIRKNYPIRL